MIIKILGSGCHSCQKLEANVKKAIEESGIKETRIEKVTDYSEIAKYGVMSLPALVVDGEVKAYGQVLTPEQVKTLIN